MRFSCGARPAIEHFGFLFVATWRSDLTEFYFNLLLEYRHLLLHLIFYFLFGRLSLAHLECRLNKYFFFCAPFSVSLESKNQVNGRMTPGDELPENSKTVSDDTPLIWAVSEAALAILPNMKLVKERSARCGQSTWLVSMLQYNKNHIMLYDGWHEFWIEPDERKPKGRYV